MISIAKTGNELFHRLYSKRREINECSENLRQVSGQIDRLRGSIERERICIAHIDHHIERLNLYQNELSEAVQQERILRERMDLLEKEKSELIIFIGVESDEFQFLMDYQNLTRDPQLNRNDIQECIEKYRTYRQE